MPSFCPCWQTSSPTNVNASDNTANLAGDTQLNSPTHSESEVIQSQPTRHPAMAPRGPNPLQVAYRRQSISAGNEDRHTEQVFNTALREIETDPSAFSQRTDLASFDPLRKLQLAKALLKASAAAFSDAFAQFQFDDEAKLQMLHAMAHDAPTMFLYRWRQLGLPGGRANLELAEILAKGDPILLCTQIRHFDIENEGDRLRIACTVAREGGPNIGPFSSFSAGIDGFNIIDSEKRLSLARFLVKHAPHVVAIKIEEFQGLAPDTLYDVVIAAYVSAIAQQGFDDASAQFSGITGYAELENLETAAGKHGNPHPAFAKLMDMARKEKDPHVAQTLLDWTRWASLCLRNVPAAACDKLEETLVAILKWRAPRDRYELVQLLCERCMSPDTGDGSDFQSFIKSIKDRKKLMKPHTRLLPDLLFPLYRGAQDAAGFWDLVGRLNQDPCKDSRVLKPVVSGLLSLIESTISVDLKRELLRIVVEGNAGKKALEFGQSVQLVGSFALLASDTSSAGVEIRSLLEQGPDGNGPQSMADLENLIGKAFALMFSVDSSDDAAMFNRFKNYLGTSRRPTGLLTYALKIQSDKSLNKEDKEAVLAAIGDFVKTAIIESEESFRQLRYDSVRSEHLEKIASAAPDKWEAWKQACLFVPSADFLSRTTSREVDTVGYLREKIMQDRHIDPDMFPNLKSVFDRSKTVDEALATADSVNSELETGLLRLMQESYSRTDKFNMLASLIPLASGQFQSDLKALRKLLAAEPPAPRDYSNWKVVDTDDAEDLLWCGTEVLGSCQSIDGSANMNKALMGYVLDGKYRMLAVTAPGGHIQARCMLRLMCEEDGTPVLHLERLYSNPGVPAELEDALQGLARQKAAQMGCALVTHENLPGTNGEYPRPIHAYGSSLPYEYVDASEDNGLHEGSEPYTFYKANVLAFAP